MTTKREYDSFDCDIIDAESAFILVFVSITEIFGGCLKLDLYYKTTYK